MNYQKISIFIQTNNLVTFSYNNKQIFLNNKLIYNSIENIIEIIITLNYVIIIENDPDLQISVTDSFKQKRKGNILIFNLHDKYLWNIEDIIDEINYPFCSGFIITNNDTEYINNTYRGIVIDESHEYFDCFNYADQHFLVDLTASQLITKKIFRS